MKPQRILGIDLGGCMSGNSAYVYAHVHPDHIQIIEAFKEPKHKEHESCQQFFIEACQRHPVDAIAIDAPLSLPAPLIDPHAPQLPREGSGEILNPYLYRYTDYYIYHHYNLRPMPPAGDRIGRLTARAIAFLQQGTYDLPHLHMGALSLPFYEVYPKQIAQALGHTNYKKDPTPLMERLHPSQVLNDIHLLDALLCCYGGGRILQGHTVMPPEGVRAEGWCFPLQGPDRLQ